MKETLYDNIVSYIVENQNKFYRLAYSYVRNQDDALDVVQNAVYKALTHYETLKNENAVKTWFYRILVNESLLFLKTEKWEFPSEDAVNTETAYYEKGYDTPDDIYEAVNQLDEDTQKVIKLRFYEELSLKEIAAVTETNLNTVKSRLYRGLKLLKQNIEEVTI
ncbi:MAG: sigma-70 family RNA polymerase sigma factor [Lachnospiraceae bacterium]|nr:sigma-70 family RNA polymerase sigma factor [Lachnospiraceae bacterium]